MTPEPITLSSLLDWTYRRQKAHLAATWRDPGAAVPAGRRWSTDGAAAAQRIMALGAHVQGRSGGWRCHPDAEEVHHVVQRWPILIRYAETGSYPAAPPSGPPRAVWRQPDRQIDKWCIAVIDGRRVDVLVDTNSQPFVEPRFVERGRRLKRLVQVGTHVVHQPCPYCPIRWEPDPSTIAAQAAELAAWLQALKEARVALLPVSLAGYRITGLGV